MRARLVGVRALGRSADGLDAQARLSVDVRTDARRVTVSSPATPTGETAISRVSATSAPVHDGHVRLSTVWRADATTGYVEPPTLRVTVRTDHGTYPFLLRITSGALADVIAAEFVGIPRDDLTNFGWDAPARS